MVSTTCFQLYFPEKAAMLLLLPTGLSGRVRFPDLVPGSYNLQIVAETTTGERHVERRTVFVCTLFHKVTNLP